MPERQDDQGAIPKDTVREDPMDEEAATRPRETRTDTEKQDVDREAREAHAPGPQATPLDEESANVRDQGMPVPPEDTWARHGNEAYHENAGRGEELTEESSDATRGDRRSSHMRVSPADRENVTEPAGRDVNE